ncbi:MAG: T9SS type A sorting domain-containing protein [Saprospiraceae bacterium]
MKSIIYIFLFFASVGIHAQNLVMKITNPQTSGSQVTYDVVADHFDDLVAAQYSVSFDPGVLSFNRVQNFNLDQLSESCFYGGIPGFITTAWIDLTLQGITLTDGTVLYQIVFDMNSGTPGGVCFSQQPLESEFAQIDSVFSSYFIVDDCHTDPFKVDLMTNTEEISAQYGLSFSTLLNDHSIHFSLNDHKTLAFRVYDMNGKQIASISEQEYTSGKHDLNLNANMLPGMYIIHTEIDHQPVAVRVIYQ